MYLDTCMNKVWVTAKVNSKPTILIYIRALMCACTVQCE